MNKRGAEELLVSPGTVESFSKKMDIKPSPSKEGGSGQEQEAIVARIQQSAPEWFTEAFTFIISTIKAESYSANVIQKQLESKIDVLENRVAHLEKQQKAQDLVITKLKDNIDSLEAYSRRDNLLIEGIPESPNENIREKVTDFFRTKLKLPDVTNIQFSRVHRLGTPPLFPRAPLHPRAVIVHFQTYTDRERAWTASWQFKDKNFFVREDYTQAMRQRRSVLLPVLKAAKCDPKIRRCSLRGDKLMIDGTRYTAKDFEKIPEHLKWTVKGERYFSNCDTTFFFGRDCCLSNHHHSPFQDNKTIYLCAEQFYLRQKSLYFDDIDTAGKIMKATDPGKMKSLSYHIKGLDEKKWNSQAKAVMEKACYLKFSQNEALRDKLLTSQGTLVEANGRDSYFSCGLALSNPNILDRSKWEGENVLGQILTSLRETFKKCM